MGNRETRTQFWYRVYGKWKQRTFQKETSSTDGKRKRDTNLETDSTVKTMAVILEHMGMVNKKVKNTTTVSSTTTEKMGKQRKIRLKG